jgi:hypothetical protein
VPKIDKPQSDRKEPQPTPGNLDWQCQGKPFKLPDQAVQRPLIKITRKYVIIHPDWKQENGEAGYTIELSSIYSPLSLLFWVSHLSLLEWGWFYGDVCRAFIWEVCKHKGWKLLGGPNDQNG